MDYKALFQNYLNVVEQRISEVVPKISPKNIYEPFDYVMKGGGKRIRPFLAMVSCGIMGANPFDALDLGVALEILHNFTLVHDDIMDESPIRRGRPTVHVKWDSATAILTGDLMIGYAYKLLPKGMEHPRSGEIMNLFTNELIEVCEGQIMDMDFNLLKDVKIMDYLQMVDKKTARLLETAVAMGANYGLGSNEEIIAIRHIARYAGLAFQIQDDLLDLTAEQEKLGKKIGQDIIEGKKTFLILTAKNLVKDKKDIKLLDKFYENNGLPESDVPKMREMFQRIGVIDLVNKEIDYYFDEARRSLVHLKPNSHRDLFEWFINSLRVRNF